jgi:hypothetical protein
MPMRDMRALRAIWTKHILMNKKPFQRNGINQIAKRSVVIGDNRIRAITSTAQLIASKVSLEEVQRGLDKAGLYE